MTKHRERAFEDEVVEHLAAHGWLLGTSAGYDRELALYPEDVLGWLEETQPNELAKLRRVHSADGEQVILRRLQARQCPLRDVPVQAGPGSQPHHA